MHCVWPVSSYRLDCARTIPSFPPVRFLCAPSSARVCVRPEKMWLGIATASISCISCSKSNLLPNTQYNILLFFISIEFGVRFLLALSQVRPLKNRDILIRLRRSNNFQTSQSICALFLFQFLFSLALMAPSLCDIAHSATAFFIHRHTHTRVFALIGFARLQILIHDVHAYEIYTRRWLAI